MKALVLVLLVSSAYANDVTVGLTGVQAGMQTGSYGGDYPTTVHNPPPVNNVPEPGTLALLAIGAVALWKRRK